MKNDLLVLKQLQMDIILLDDRLKDLHANLFTLMNNLVFISQYIPECIYKIEGKKFIQINNEYKKGY